MRQDYVAGKRARLSQAYVLRGIYDHLRDVPGYGLGFTDEVYSNTARQEIEEMLSQGSNSSPITDHTQGARQPLPLLIGLLQQNSPPIRILDFGGGLGTDYLVLRSNLKQDHNLEYHVVDHPAFCKIGDELFHDDTHITFSETLPSAPTPPDVVYMNSVLQYIDDFPATLRELCVLRAKFILLVRHAMGQQDTFASGQVNVPGSLIPYWLFNRRELISLLATEGYDVICQSMMRFPSSLRNFPVSHRISGYGNLLFRLSSD